MSAHPSLLLLPPDALLSPQILLLLQNFLRRRCLQWLTRNNAGKRRSTDQQVTQIQFLKKTGQGKNATCGYSELKHILKHERFLQLVTTFAKLFYVPSYWSISLHWIRIPFQRPLEVLVFQYCRYYIVRQIQAWHLLLCQQTSISYDTYGYNLQISKHWKSTSEADYCSWQQLWLCCAFLTEKQELCKSSGHGKRWLQDGKWRCKSKGGGGKKPKTRIKNSIHIYKNLFRWSHKHFFF